MESTPCSCQLKGEHTRVSSPHINHWRRQNLFRVLPPSGCTSTPKLKDMSADSLDPPSHDKNLARHIVATFPIAGDHMHGRRSE